MSNTLRFKFEVQDADLISDLKEKQERLIEKFKSLNCKTISDLNPIFDLCKYELHRRSSLEIIYPEAYVRFDKLTDDTEIVVHILPAIRDFSKLHKDCHPLDAKKP